MPDWYPSDYYIQPHYSTMPEYLRIADVFAPGLAPQGAGLWRKARDQALAKWNPVGFGWRVREDREPYLGNRVTLNMEYINYRIGGWACFECDPAEPHDPCEATCPNAMAWVHVDDETWEDAFDSGYLGTLRYVLCHEIGHVLGFGHGGTGIMSATYKQSLTPNAEEIAAARAYWGPDG